VKGYPGPYTPIGLQIPLEAPTLTTREGAQGSQPAKPFQWLRRPAIICRQTDASSRFEVTVWCDEMVAPTGSAHGTSYSFRGSSSCRLEVIKGSPGDVTEAESGLLVARWHGPLLPTKPIEVPCPRGGLEL